MLIAGESLQLPSSLGGNRKSWECLFLFFLLPWPVEPVVDFASIVASGTTSKQIRRETDARR